MKGLVNYLFNKYCGWAKRRQLNKEIAALEHVIAGSKEKKRILFFQLPSHTNIGDHAIADATTLFLRTYLPEYFVIEINQDYHFALLPKIQREVSEKDILVLIGGGNFGNQYMHEEYIRRSVLKNFPSNKIVIFPQTVFYSSDEQGRRELKIMQELIANTQDVVLTARESVSLDLMKKFFPQARTIFTPDIVLSVDRVDTSCKREGILMVLRDDEEKVLNDQIHHDLDEFVRTVTTRVVYSDMHHHEGVRDDADRKVMLAHKFRQFQSTELVITDRLHGMVFAAVTGTPCIAFSNYNQKISGTYEWIKHLDYIRFVNPGSDWKDEALALLSRPAQTKFDPARFKKQFAKIIDVIDE